MEGEKDVKEQNAEWLSEKHDRVLKSIFSLEKTVQSVEVVLGKIVSAFQTERASVLTDNWQTACSRFKVVLC